MAIDLAGSSGRSLIYDGLAQTDLDMANHKLLNLDDSNLDFGASPPTVGPIPHQWLNSWNSTTRTWGISQPGFADLTGFLTHGQKVNINEVGVITAGQWQGTPIAPLYAPTLDHIRPPLGDLSMDSHKIINLADPVNPQDAVNKRFMDFLLQGLNVHEAVRVATVTRVVAQDFPIIDGIQVVANDRVLAKNGNPGEEPFFGIYIVRAGVWAIADDFNEVDEQNRAYVNVREGTINGGTGWVQVNPITALGQPKKWVYFSTAGGEPGPPGPPGLGVPAGGDTGMFLMKRTGADNDTIWALPVGTGTPQYAALQTPFQAPNGTNDFTNGRMMGLAGYITPLTSGKVVIMVAGSVKNDSAAGVSLIQLIGGSGTAPANGVIRPVSGTQVFGPIIRSDQTAASKSVPFSTIAVIPGTIVGNRIWFDLLLQPVLPHGSTSTIPGVCVSGFEIP